MSTPSEPDHPSPPGAVVRLVFVAAIGTGVGLLVVGAAMAARSWTEMRAPRPRRAPVRLERTPERGAPGLTIRLAVEGGAVVAHVGDGVFHLDDVESRSALCDAVARFVESGRRRVDGAPQIEVEAESDVPTDAVVRAVDAAIEGGAEDVTFVGTPPPGSELERVRARR